MRVADEMFAKVFLLCCLAVAARAYQIPYQNLEVPKDTVQYGMYHPLMGLMKNVMGKTYPDYYTPEEEQVGDVQKMGEMYMGPYQYPYYQQYLLKYPMMMNYYQGQNVPSYYYQPYGYKSMMSSHCPCTANTQMYQMPHSYPLMNKILGGYGYHKHMMMMPDMMMMQNMMY